MKYLYITIGVLAASGGAYYAYTKIKNKNKEGSTKIDPYSGK